MDDETSKRYAEEVAATREAWRKSEEAAAEKEAARIQKEASDFAAARKSLEQELDYAHQVAAAGIRGHRAPAKTIKLQQRPTSKPTLREWFKGQPMVDVTEAWVLTEARAGHDPGHAELRVNATPGWALGYDGLVYEYWYSSPSVGRVHEKSFLTADIAELERRFWPGFISDDLRQARITEKINKCADEIHRYLIGLRVRMED